MIHLALVPSRHTITRVDNGLATTSCQMSDSPRPTPTLVISDLPPTTLVGIDLFSFNSTPNFYGVKDLPPGAHFLYTSTTESFSLRSGEWFYVGENGSPNQLARQSHIDIRLRKWDKALEAVVPVDENSDAGRQQAMRQRANLGRIWASGGFLAYQSQLNARPTTTVGDGANTISYQHERAPSRGDWQRLSSSISPSVLDRILGQSDSLDQRWTITSGSSASRDTDYIPGLSTTDMANSMGVAGEREKELRFIPVDLKKTWREGAIGRERTEAAQDRSWALGDLIKHGIPAPKLSDVNSDAAGEEQVLGELQFTFLMVLTLMNFSSLEQWKRLLGLILTCKSAMKEREDFFVKVLQLLRLQLCHFEDVEGGLFEMDGDDGGNYLKSLLIKFKKSVDESEASGEMRVKKEFARLENWIKSKYGWELSRRSIVRRGMLELEDGEQVEMELSGAEEEDETGEYAPVIVDLEEPVLAEHPGEDIDMTDTPSQ
ncbi:AAR2 family protein [Coccidioides immitis RS]|uniref:AAR2 family protein n=1 Tax=Coccidioides immitis (strain RS) TaxID=246410 RepID=J3KDA6_COCIM|nr:AAR2 family protein [Coccidioides immitis RS]EAS33323.3 AAR2 family protein [Coccidioides immitis RS]